MSSMSGGLYDRANATARLVLEPVQTELFSAPGAQPNAWADYDNDGDLDLFVAHYGPDFLYRNNGNGTFDNVAPTLGLAVDRHATTSAWGDFDNDGWPDLLVASYMGDVPEEPDHLYQNDGGAFVDIPGGVLEIRVESR